MQMQLAHRQAVRGLSKPACAPRVAAVRPVSVSVRAEKSSSASGQQEQAAAPDADRRNFLRT
jgi:hypothetical protein